LRNIPFIFSIKSIQLSIQLLKIGNIPVTVGRLKLREGVSPVYIKTSPVPFPSRIKLKRS
jgi:hypothetical protein